MLAIDIVIRYWASLLFPSLRNERGLSQSTENAILLAGAVSIALVVVTLITKFVESRLPK